MSSHNPFLKGNFAPTALESSEACTEIVGKIPTDIEGSFLRNGPNNQFSPLSDPLYHWFDGDGMIHQLALNNGDAHYSNRWIETRGFQYEREEGKALWQGFKSLPDFDNKYGMPAKNVANTALVWHADRLLATWEAGSAYEVSLPELITTGEEDFNGDWKYATSAHPKVCPQTGELINFCYNPMGKFQVHYSVIDPHGKLIHKTGIKLKGKPVMIHDLAITPNFSIIMDMPITFDIERAMKGDAPFEWEAENGCRMGILPRYADGEAIQWFDVELGYVFHILNAWEEGGEIVLEACKAERVSISLEEQGADEDKLDGEASISEEKGKPHQYRFNLKTGEVSEHRITETALEFTRINEAYLGLKNRYAYGSRFCMDKAKPLFDAVVKLDRAENTEEILPLGEGCFTGEFVFAPKTSSNAEDEGYYVGFVRNEKKQQSECWIIDAQHFLQGPVAKIILPVRVPYGFHAQWVSKESLERQTLKLG